MSTPEYFVAYEGLKKREQPRHPKHWDLCPVTEAFLENAVLVAAPPEYPQLAEGLEIGAIYEYEFENMSLYFAFERRRDEYFFDWCEQLVVLTTGSTLEGGPRMIIDWCNDLSDLVVDKQKYPETDGRGPFWELLRYLLRGMTFGPVVCAKLVADFDAWDPDIRSRSDDEFYEFYCKMREYFSCGTEKDALVTYPSWWSDREGNIILEPKLGAEPGVLPGNCR